MASLSPSSLSTTSSNSDVDISPPNTPRTRIAFPSLAFSARSSGMTGVSSIPLKSPPSPPTITPFPTADISSFSFSTGPTRPSPPLSSLSPTSAPFSGSSPTLFSTNSPYAHCAYPSWPRSDSLSPCSSAISASSSSSSILSADSYNFPTSPATSTPPSSYISDEDLLDLETLPLYNNIRIPREFLVAATPGATDTGMMDKERRRPRSKRVVLPADVQTASVPVLVSASSKANVEESLKLRSRRRSSPLKRRKMILGLSPVVEAME